MKHVSPSFMNKGLLFLLALVSLTTTAVATPLQIYGAWHCSNDACLWGTVRNMTDFDAKNHWLIDRGDGLPSVNLVVLSFVNPLKLLNRANDSQTVNGVPVGMNQPIVSYFTSRNVRVMLSIGGRDVMDDMDTPPRRKTNPPGPERAAAPPNTGAGGGVDYAGKKNPKPTPPPTFIVPDPSHT